MYDDKGGYSGRRTQIDGRLSRIERFKTEKPAPATPTPAPSLGKASPSSFLTRLARTSLRDAGVSAGGAGNAGWISQSSSSIDHSSPAANLESRLRWVETAFKKEGAPQQQPMQQTPTQRPQPTVPQRMPTQAPNVPRILMQTTTPTASFNPIQPAVVPQQQPIAPRPTVTQPTHIPSVLNTPAQTQQAHVPSVLTTLPLQQIINAPATPQAPAEQPVLPQMPVVQSPNLGGNKIAVEALKCRVQKLILELDSIHKELTALEQKLN